MLRLAYLPAVKRPVRAGRDLYSIVLIKPCLCHSQNDHEDKSAQTSDIRMPGRAIILCSRTPDSDRGYQIVGNGETISQKQGHPWTVKNDEDQEEEACHDVDEYSDRDGPGPECLAEGQFAAPKEAQFGHVTYCPEFAVLFD
jgi:hypothetical protein